MSVRLFRELADAAWLAREHHDRGRTVADIAVEVGCTPNGVRKALRRHGIEYRYDTRGRARELSDREWLQREHVDQGRPIADIAVALGCTAAAVRYALHRAGIDVTPGPHPKSFAELWDPDWLRRRYIAEGLTIRQIADELGCSREPVRRSLHREQIPVRPTGQTCD